MRRIFLLFLLLLPLLAACNGGAAVGPTPFPSPAPTLMPTGQGPAVLTVTELAAAPGLYRDAVVQLTGLFRKQPLLVCESEAHPSPATWGLGEEGVQALAGGFDEEVRLLLPEGLLMTVEGRWRRWEGLIGCGKQAVSREVWYLDVARILSPTPLTQVTLTPSAGEPTAVAEVPPEGSQPTAELLPTEDGSLFPTPLVEATPEPLFPTDTPEGSSGLPDDPFATAGPTPETTLLPENTPTIDPFATPTITTTPPGTGTPGTPGPTVTGTPPTPTATSSGTGQIVPKGDLYDLDEEFASTTLAAGTTDSWTIELFEDEILNVSAIAPLPADLVLSVIKDGQVIINRQNNAPAGAAEIIDTPNLPGEGIYEVHVATQGGQATEYAIIANIDPEFPIIFNSIVTPGSPRSAVVMPADSVHYWFFTANAGDDLTLTVRPNAGDPIIDLYGPGAEYIESIDEGGEGEDEVFEVTLTTTGLHAIRLMEIDGLSMTYDIEVTLE